MDVKIFNVPKACARNGEKQRKKKKREKNGRRREISCIQRAWHIVKVYLKGIPKGVYTYNLTSKLGYHSFAYYP